MSVENITLRYKTSADKIMKHFNLDCDGCNDIIGPSIIGDKNIKTWICMPLFLTGEPYHTAITLIFNKNKKLIIMNIDYFDEINLKVCGYDN